MARNGKRTPSIDEKLQEVEAQIAELEARREALLAEKQEVDTRKLMEFLKLNNLTVYDAMAAVSAATQRKAEEV